MNYKILYNDGILSDKNKIDWCVINWVVIFGSKKEKLHNRVVHQ